MPLAGQGTKGVDVTLSGQAQSPAEVLDGMDVMGVNAVPALIDTLEGIG